jgi:indole-3-glycerol phosphate synthase
VKVVSIEYPEVREVLPERARMRLFNDAENCISCTQCAMACPVDCIYITSEKQPEGAEIKKASPSKGIIRADFNPAEIAEQYEQAGAACLSVLTDVDFFQGADENIAIARSHCALPALRKDFLIDPYNVVEARALHADCILLIVASLSDQQLEEMSKTAFEYNLDVLVEVHDEDELERALKLSDRCLLGVNNRNLKTFDVDLNTSLRLKKLLDPQRLLVTESGIATTEDVKIMQDHDIHSFLVGESFMKQPDPAQAFQALFGRPEQL